MYEWNGEGWVNDSDIFITKIIKYLFKSIIQVESILSYYMNSTWK